MGTWLISQETEESAVGVCWNSSGLLIDNASAVLAHDDAIRVKKWVAGSFPLSRAPGSSKSGDHRCVRSIAIAPQLKIGSCLGQLVAPLALGAWVGAWDHTSLNPNSGGNLYCPFPMTNVDVFD